MHFSPIDRPAVGLTYLPPPLQLILFVLSHMAEHPVCEADSQLPYRTEVKSMWNYTSIFPYIFGSRRVWPVRTGVAMLLRGDIGSSYGWLLSSSRGDRCEMLLLRPRPSVHGEEPYPTRGDPVTQNTADLKE